MEWLGIPWWVWVFVIPELAITVIFLLVAAPAAAIAALRGRLRGDRS